jgi:diphthamide synthase (EF-2-diphthine--ammonia ligase)
MPAARSALRSTTERSITQMSNRVLVSCLWCGGEFHATITDAPVEEARYRIYYHRECKKKYLKYSEELDAKLQRLYGTKRRRYERLK